MSGLREPERPWLDILDRKHECGPSLSDHRLIDVPHEGGLIAVSMPDRLGPGPPRIRATLLAGDLLTLIAHQAWDDDPEGRGVLMVARRRDDGRFVVHVWHELYPWALDHLGLGPG